MTIPTVPVPGLEEAIQQRQAQKEEAATPAQSDAEKTFKRVLAGVVAIATIGAITLPQHTIGYHVCQAVVGIGAALGITSTGNQKR